MKGLKGGWLYKGLGVDGSWRGGSVHSFTLHYSVVDLGCQHLCQPITVWLPALKKDLRAKGKSVFGQIKTDGQGVTLKPSHLTGTNACTRLPVEATALPSKSPFQIDSASNATEKYLWSARSQPQIRWSLSSIRNAIFPPVGFKLSLSILNIPLLWYLWALWELCVTLFTIKCRILECVTRPNFIMPHRQDSRS